LECPAHKPWRLAKEERSLVGLSAGNKAAIREIIYASFDEAKPLTHNAYKIALAKNAAARATRLAVQVSI
jgi:xanthine dehydrogenase YagS FAD-binding subunit